MTAFTQTQLSNPIIAPHFKGQQNKVFTRILSGNKDIYQDEVSLMCIAGTHLSVRNAFKQICWQEAENGNLDISIKSIQEVITVPDIESIQTLWEILAYLHQLRGDVEEGHSLGWLMGEHS
jgi:hypothetical protein